MLPQSECSGELVTRFLCVMLQRPECSGELAGRLHVLWLHHPAMAAGAGVGELQVLVLCRHQYCNRYLYKCNRYLCKWHVCASTCHYTGVNTPVKVYHKCDLFYAFCSNLFMTPILPPPHPDNLWQNRICFNNLQASPRISCPGWSLKKKKIKKTTQGN